MEKKQFDSLTGMPLDPPPLVYLHEHFKKLNEKYKYPLQNNWVWYSKDDLEAIKKAIEQIGIDQPEKKGDGIRVYYGIYNKQVCDYLTALSKQPGHKERDYSDHVGHNTVFFVPTYEGTAEDEHVDCISKANANDLQEAYKNGLDLPEPFEGGFNVGNICPPPVGECKNSGSNL